MNHEQAILRSLRLIVASTSGVGDGHCTPLHSYACQMQSSGPGASGGHLRTRVTGSTSTHAGHTAQAPGMRHTHSCLAQPLQLILEHWERLTGGGLLWVWPDSLEFTSRAIRFSRSRRPEGERGRVDS